MNKRGEGLIVYILGLIVFAVLWFGWLGGLFNTMAGVAISNGANGVSGFLLANLNLLIFFFFLMGVAWIVSKST